MQEHSKPPAKAQIPIETGNIPESIPYLTDPTLRSSNERARLAWKIILSLPQPTAVWPHTRSILISKTTDESPNDNTRSISDSRPQYIPTRPPDETGKKDAPQNFEVSENPKLPTKSKNYAVTKLKVF